ncbi:N-succinylarginine dihydrolase [Streptomyces sp. ISL-90]|nr:N-succinylarginine dihydrolase [Streptomyces sp. ISL-90]
MSRSPRLRSRRGRELHRFFERQQRFEHHETVPSQHLVGDDDAAVGVRLVHELFEPTPVEVLAFMGVECRPEFHRRMQPEAVLAVLGLHVLPREDELLVHAELRDDHRMHVSERVIVDLDFLSELAEIQRAHAHQDIGGKRLGIERIGRAVRMSVPLRPRIPPACPLTSPEDSSTVYLVLN